MYNFSRLGSSPEAFSGGDLQQPCAHQRTGRVEEEHLGLCPQLDPSLPWKRNHLRFGWHRLAGAWATASVSWIKTSATESIKNRPCSVPKKTKTPYVTPKTALKDLSCQQSTSQCLKATPSHDGYWKNAVKGGIWKQRQQSVRKSFTQGVPLVAPAHPQDVSLDAAVHLWRNRAYFETAGVLHTPSALISLRLQVLTLLYLRPESPKILRSPTARVPGPSSQRVQILTDGWWGGQGHRQVNILGQCEHSTALLGILKQLHANNRGWRLIKVCRNQKESCAAAWEMVHETPSCNQTADK